MKASKLKKLFKESEIKVNISSPEAFKCSVKELKKGGVKPEERQAIKKAQLRARIQLKRKDLSKKEKAEFRKIMNSTLPKVTRPKKRKEKKHSLF